MKKFLKPEMVIFELNIEDVITTSGDTVALVDKSQTDTTGNAHDSKDYSAGLNDLWNLPLQ